MEDYDDNSLYSIEDIVLDFMDGWIALDLIFLLLSLSKQLKLFNYWRLWWIVVKIVI